MLGLLDWHLVVGRVWDDGASCRVVDILGVRVCLNKLWWGWGLLLLLLLLMKLGWLLLLLLLMKLVWLLLLLLLMKLLYVRWMLPELLLSGRHGGKNVAGDGNLAFGIRNRVNAGAIGRNPIRVIYRPVFSKIYD